jgi:hypothetical protein
VPDKFALDITQIREAAEFTEHADDLNDLLGN